MNGWRALVTGGGRGIGRATVAALRERGADVIVADMDPELARQTAKELGGTPARLDITQPDQIQALFASLDHLDVLVLNAGKPYRRTTLNATDAEWEECLGVNLRGSWQCARAAHPLLLRSDRASIVTVASEHGFRSSVDSFPYSAAKGGLLALTRTLAVEYAPHIRANAVVPGQVESVRTEPYFQSFTSPEEARRRTLQSIPLRRLATPEDVAQAIVFLASPEAAYITGIDLRVDGGRSAALLDLSDLREAAP